MRGCKGAYNKSSDYFSRRAYGSARQQIHRRAFKHLLSNKQRRSDHSYGNAFCQGGKSCRTRDVYQGRPRFFIRYTEETRLMKSFIRKFPDTLALLATGGDSK